MIYDSPLKHIYKVYILLKSLLIKCNRNFVNDTFLSIEITYIYPTYGPRSGGTRVTLIGQNMNDVINVLFTEPCDECNEVMSSYDVDESCFR